MPKTREVLFNNSEIMNIIEGLGDKTDIAGQYKAMLFKQYGIDKQYFDNYRFCRINGEQPYPFSGLVLIKQNCALLDDGAVLDMAMHRRLPKEIPYYVMFIKQPDGAYAGSCYRPPNVIGHYLSTCHAPIDGMICVDYIHIVNTRIYLDVETLYKDFSCDNQIVVTDRKIRMGNGSVSNYTLPLRFDAFGNDMETEWLFLLSPRVMSINLDMALVKYAM